jgi:hypothetical protein
LSRGLSLSRKIINKEGDGFMERAVSDAAFVAWDIRELRLR